MTNWTQVMDAHGATARVPALLEQVERSDAPAAWDELGNRLCLHGETVSPASFAALPRLAALAPHRDRALDLACAIMRGAVQHHGGDALLATCTEAIAALRELADRRLRSRPSDYQRAFGDLLALAGQYHWAAAMEGFSDDFYPVPCPRCDVEVIVAIGEHGHYSAIRDWDRGDIDRRALRPAPAEDLSGLGRWLHATAVRDGQPRLAEGIRHLFGRAECPRCASVFGIAEAYTLANLAPSW
ncbi:hypothetical protein [Kitasatospora sp. NPDC094011]|uniref:hypothetical protein n=1 Tax=Kitasatospora sp. NPDC094011 TaxID=3364090 RepID=UPI00380A3ACD